MKQVLPVFIGLIDCKEDFVIKSLSIHASNIPPLLYGILKNVYGILKKSSKILKNEGKIQKIPEFLIFGGVFFTRFWRVLCLGNFTICGLPNRHLRRNLLEI